MGDILCARRQENTIVVELQLSAEEYRQLRGEMSGVHIFSEHATATPSKVSLRGRNEATKYFLIPRQLRRQLPIQGSVSCQRVDKDGKLFFIYVLDPYKRERGSKLVL